MSRYESPTTINASKGFGEVILYVNRVTGNLFAHMLLIGIWIIIFVGFYKSKDDPAGAFAVAGYGTFVVGLLFWIGGWVSAWAFSIVTGFTIIGTIVLLTQQ
jgi:hypothetical protein